MYEQNHLAHKGRGVITLSVVSVYKSWNTVEIKHKFEMKPW